MGISLLLIAVYEDAEKRHHILVGGMLAGGVANAAINNGWADFGGGLVGSIAGTAIGMGGVKAYEGSLSSAGGTSSSSVAEVIQETVESNPSDLQGAIDAGRSVGGEAGAMQAAEAVTNINVDVRGAVEKTMLSGALEAAGEISVKVPYAGKGKIFSSVGRAGVLRGGGKSIVARAGNALGVVAKAAGKFLHAAEAFKYANSAGAAWNRGDYLSFSHDGAMSVLFGIGAVAPGIGKAAPYLGTAMDVGTKLYGNGAY